MLSALATDPEGNVFATIALRSASGQVLQQRFLVANRVSATLIRERALNPDLNPATLYQVTPIRLADVPAQLGHYLHQRVAFILTLLLPDRTNAHLSKPVPFDLVLTTHLACNQQIVATLTRATQDIAACTGFTAQFIVYDPPQ